MEDDRTIKEQLLPKEDWELPIDIGFRRCTKALFYEFRFQTTVKVQAPYTLKDYDHTVGGTVYISMYKIYMKCDSEYEAAIVLLGSYPHWQKLKKCKWFQEYVERWETERNIRDEALARTKLVELAERGNVTAARTLFANSKVTDKERGRPKSGGKRAKGGSHSTLEEMLGIGGKGK